MLKLEVKPYSLDFKFSAKTSRGEIKERKVWFIQITNELGQSGIGEVAPINRLSPEDPEEVPYQLSLLAEVLATFVAPKGQQEVYKLVGELVPIQFPSIRFGVEMALMDLINGGLKKIFAKDLGSISVPINGLIWMGDVDFMQEQIMEKLDLGYQCIKLKVGALDFEAEVELIRKLRAVSEELVIRLDANGGFQTHEVLGKLKVLSKFSIHSIEQPILPMQPEAMELICKKSEIPIAFDEELIHVFSAKEKMDLIQELKPQYLVLKPTLHGGFSGVSEWIDLAHIHGVAWWITSYLESNVGLNAISQFTSTFQNNQYHGLGTGNLYHNNIASPLTIENGELRYLSSNVWDPIF